MILIDTSLIIWLTHGDSKMGGEARELIGSCHPINYSSMSLLEMTIKSMKGKLRMPEGLSSILDGLGLRQMPFVAEHAEVLREFPELSDHDPFDRALVAQAAAEGLMFLTADRRILALKRDWIVNAAA
ncbi:MAG: type II toxin-antitoxin system VapC family toxin [Aeromicrobium sp.]|uniref:type II toxin-antitoxin system VapC family toxin n=1 Tax=Aeromicrobium sp. TaxID=1871063 RepID=UPI0039E366CC